MIYKLIDEEKARYSIAFLCRTLEVTRSAWYEWRRAGQSQRAREDQRLKVHVRAAHRGSRGTYGSPRIRKQLSNEGVQVGRRRVARLMREEGLAGTPKKRFRNTTDSTHKQPIAANLLARDFLPAQPNEAWVTDITYISTSSGFLYLVVFIDLFSKKVVGWSARTHMRADLCLDALKQAIVFRNPKPGLIIHSDRGCQYASHGFSGFLEQCGFKQSMSVSSEGIRTLLRLAQTPLRNTLGASPTLPSSQRCSHLPHETSTSGPPCEHSSQNSRKSDMTSSRD